MNFYKHQIFIVCFCVFGLIVSAQQNNSLKNDSLNTINGILNSITNPDTDTSLVLIADITVHGNKKTKPYIIERELPFKQGDYIRRNDLEKKLVLAKQQVMNTSLFTSVAVYVHSQQSELVFINVDVKERWYLFPLPYFKLIDRNFNQWWVEQKASINRTNYGIKFIQNNVSGRNDKLNINLIAGYSRQVQLRYEQPFADNSLKKGFSVAFNFLRQRELNYGSSFSKQSFYKQGEFVLQNIHGEIAYLYRPAIKTRHSVKFAWTSVSVSDTVLHLNPNYFSNSNKTHISYPEISYTIQYLNTDYNAYPSKGLLADASIIRKGINEDMNLTQLQYHASYTTPLSKKMRINFQSAGILKLPFDQPFYNQQLFGYGDAFLRGLEYYVQDGVVGILGRATISREMLAVTLKTPPQSKKEVIVPLSFFLKAGSDIGYTYTRTPGSSLLSNKFLYTECVGLDLVIPSYDLVFKFEYSFNQLGQQGLFFHVRTDF